MAGDDRDGRSERLLRAPDGLLVEERDDRLAERHALDREQAVPARVELVDDDVGVPEALERLLVMEPLDDLEIGVEAFDRRDHVLGALASPRRGRVQDHGPRAVGRRRGGDPRDIDPGREHLRLGHPADRVVAADDLGAGLLAVRELLRGLAANVRAEVVHDGLLPEQSQRRKLHRARHEREAEDEMEDVGLREQIRERTPLGRLAAREAAGTVERDVRLGVQRVALEHDEPARRRHGAAAPPPSSTGRRPC